VSSPADRSSPESAAWTSASPGPGGGTPSSPRLSHSVAQSSPSGSPASPSTPTSATSPSAAAGSRGERPAEAMTFQARYFTRGMGTEPTRTPTVTAQSRNGDSENLLALTSSPSEALAKTSPSQESGEDLTATDPASSGKPCESPEMALFDPEPYSWRTWKGSCQATVDGTLHSSWTRWPSAGIGGATGYSTRSTSVSPSVDGEFSWSASLTTILEPNASERYSLSQKAAAGILRRASRRGRTLPPALEQALRAVAESAR
jgi:hypothetical protein